MIARSERDGPPIPPHGDSVLTVARHAAATGADALRLTAHLNGNEVAGWEMAEMASLTDVDLRLSAELDWTGLDWASFVLPIPPAASLGRSCSRVTAHRRKLRYTLRQRVAAIRVRNLVALRGTLQRRSIR